MTTNKLVVAYADAGRCTGCQLKVLVARSSELVFDKYSLKCPSCRAVSVIGTEAVRPFLDSDDRPVDSNPVPKACVHPGASYTVPDGSQRAVAVLEEINDPTKRNAIVKVFEKYRRPPPRDSMIDLDARLHGGPDTSNDGGLCVPRHISDAILDLDPDVVPCGRGFALRMREAYPNKRFMGKSLAWSVPANMPVQTQVGDPFESKSLAMAARKNRARSNCRSSGSDRPTSGEPVSLPSPARTRS